MISPRTARLLPVLLSGLAMLGPFTINMYMPSFAEMREVLGVTDVQLQITLSLYFVSFAFMSLWHGAIADSFGRRPVVLVGLIVFALASLGVACSTRIEFIYVFRVFQGLSAGAGIVVGRAVIRDLYAGASAQRMYATVIMLFAVAPAVGPVIGGWLQVEFGWRSPFIFLVLMSSLLLTLVWFVLPETLPQAQRQPFSVVGLTRAYREVLTNLPFLGWAAAFALMFGGFFIYVLSAPIFVMHHLGLKETEFIWLFGPATAGMMLGSFLCSRYFAEFAAGTLLRLGFSIMVLAFIWNLGVCLLQPASFYWYLPYLFIYTLGMALVQPTITMLGLDCVPDRRGMGSSLQLFAQTGFNSVLSAVIAPFFWDTPLHLASGAGLLMGLGLAGSWLALWLGRRQSQTRYR